MKIQSGTAMGSKDEFDWELHKGHGPRSFRTTIGFDQPFSQPPKVVLSLVGFDIQEGEPSRIWVKVHKTEHNQFQLEYKTWASTKVHSMRVHWIAYGT